MEQYKIKSIIGYLKNRLELSNDIVKNLNGQNISLDDYLKGFRKPKSFVSVKRDINLIKLTNDEIDEFVGVLELLLNRYDINTNTGNTSLISYIDYIVIQLEKKLEADTNYVARDMLKEKLDRFRAITVNSESVYGLNPNIQGSVEVTDDAITFSNKDLKRRIKTAEEALLFNLSLQHRNTEILANDLLVGYVNDELRIVMACDYFFYDMVSNNMYGITEVSNLQPLNSYLESKDLDLMVNGYYTYDRLTKILGHIQRLRDMSKEEATAFFNLSIQGSLQLTDYIRDNTNISNEELDEARLYLQKYFYDRLIRKGKTDLRVTPKLDHGHPLDCALNYGQINPERCDINLFMKISDHDISTSIGHLTPRGMVYEESVTIYEMGYQYKK